MRVYTMREITAELGISTATVSRWTAAGRLQRLDGNQYVIPDGSDVRVQEMGQRVRQRERAKEAAESEPEPVNFREAGEGFFHPSQDGYVFSALPGQRKACLLPRATVEGLVSDYTAGRATINEVATRYGLTRAQVQHILRSQGVTHDSPPYTDRQISEAAEAGQQEALVQDWLALQKSKLVTSHQRARWEQTTRDAERWRLFEAEALPLLRSVVPPAPVRPVPRVVDPEDLCAWVTPTDAHIGMTADPDGEVDVVCQAAATILDPHRVHTAYIGMGSDWMHFDTPQKTTTKGTQMASLVEYGDLLRIACEGAVRYVETVRQCCRRVVVVHMGGNHDTASALAVTLYLDAYYRDCPDVVIHRSTAPRTYVTFGQCLFGVSHGHAGKAEDYPRLMASEAPDEWGRCRHRAFFHGHLHHSRVRDMHGVRLVQLPALCGGSAWERSQGYVGSERGVELWVFDAEAGFKSMDFLRVED
jgi:hypothetical protein